MTLAHLNIEANCIRAYIAASRRSDRSLEARVESARRASEIHKRRTGRSLRVTEQDVVNEEMYEEEDDDLPMQYRRLTAHLRTDSADFDRRLAAYLTNHVAMRSALDQAITSSYAQQYPNAPQFAHNQSATFPSPMLPQQMMRNPAAAHRQSPYPQPSAPGFRQQSHARSSSIATSQEMSAIVSSPVTQGNATSDRRMSLPTTSATTPIASAFDVQQPASAHASSPPFPNFSDQQQRHSPTQNQPHQQHQLQQQHFMQPPHGTNSLGGDYSMFSTTLPTESQLLLGSTLDPQDPLTAMFMAGNGSVPLYNPNQATPDLKNHGVHPSFDGINATLAPSALDLSANQSMADGPASAPAFKMHSDSLDDNYKPAHLDRSISTNGSGISDDWGAFIDDNSWD